MAERGDGAVIIVSSIAGMRASRGIGGYGISKAADFSLARNLAVEWGPRNVRVNCIAPGLIKTDFARALWEDPARLAKRTRETPLRRIGQAHEIGPGGRVSGLLRGELYHRPDYRGRWRIDDRLTAVQSEE